MQSIVTLTVFDHAPGFVLTALVVCSVTAAMVVKLLARAERLAGRSRRVWVALMALVAGVGVWTTHFVAMLGYRPDVLLGYDPSRTLISALVGVALVGGPLAATCFVTGRGRRMLLGGLAGLGVGAMHYMGMSALEGCLVSYDPIATGLALAFGSVAFAAAFGVWRGRGSHLRSGALIVLGVCALHFTGIAGATVTSTIGLGAVGFDTLTLTALVTLASLALSAAAFAAVAASARLEAQGRAADQARRRQHDLLAAALHNMSNGLVMVGADGRIKLFNERVRDLLRLEPGEIAVGMPLATYLDNAGARNGWDAERRRRVIENHGVWMARSETTRLEHRLDGGAILSVACRPLRHGGAVLTYDDVTEHRTAQAALTHMAYHDALTGLPNRRSFREEIERMLTEGRGIAVLMLDLDRFKNVNDTLGHPVGDALLVEVAARLREVCRLSDKVFRLGGDELAVLPQAADDDDAGALGRRIVASFQRPFIVEGHRIGIGCSIGLAWSETGDAQDHIVQKADLALYRAKALGRNRVEHYESGMVEKAMARRQLELDLARALREGEFELCYQPLYALPANRLFGFEALIRWNHPTRGLVSPVDFIPLAEENGMILEIGTWVLDSACRQAAKWPRDMHVAVNVSAVQMRSAGIVAQVIEAIARHGIAASQLELELTETALVEDGARIAEALRALRRLGVRIAMDDFGTGYSSLAHLRDFELDRIKIDRSFIDTRSDDAGGRAVVRAVAGMARDLAILTIGEGVETEEQLARLIELGCDGAQGYLLGRPMAADAAGRMIAVQTFEDDAAADRSPDPGEATDLRDAKATGTDGV